MKQIDPAVRKETQYVSLFVLILSALMESVFLMLRRWSLSVLFGNLLGASVAILNFFLMGLTVQKAVGKDPKEARDAVKASQRYRLLLQLIPIVLSLALSAFFHPVCAILPLFFPRVAFALFPLVRRKDLAEVAPTTSEEDQSQ